MTTHINNIYHANARDAACRCADDQMPSRSKSPLKSEAYPEPVCQSSDLVDILHAFVSQCESR